VVQTALSKQYFFCYYQGVNK